MKTKDLKNEETPSYIDKDLQIMMLKSLNEYLNKAINDFVKHMKKAPTVSIELGGKKYTAFIKSIEDAEDKD